MNPVLTANAAKSLVSLSDKYLQSLMPCEKKNLSLLHPLTNLIPRLFALILKTGSPYVV